MIAYASNHSAGVFMIEISVMFMASFLQGSPNASFDPFAWQTISWLNESFPCHSFRMVDHDADIYIGLTDTKGYDTCGSGWSKDYMGCARYSTDKVSGIVYLHPRLFTPLDEWNEYRHAVTIHEFEHQFIGIANHYKLTKTTKELYKERYCK